jgi:uncharacterized alpha-E superfamily protein
MMSRVAEHCFWLARYLERAENIARVLEVNQTLLLDFDVPFEQQWKPLLIISGIHNFGGPFDAETIQNYLTWDRDNVASIASSIAFARENARIIREVISADMWERINYYYLWLQSAGARDLYDNNRADFYNQIKRINQLVDGIGEGTMLHGEPWDFFKFGKYLERACQTARILDVKYHLVQSNPQLAGTDLENAHWTAILKSCSGYEPFHKQRYSLERKLGVAVAGFLIFEPIFPRSIAFCLNACRDRAHAISGRPLDQPKNEIELLLFSLSNRLSSTTVDDMVRTDLHEGLTHIVNRTHEIGDAVFRTYFDFKPEDIAQTAGKNGQSQTQTQVGQSQTQKLAATT